MLPYLKVPIICTAFANAKATRGPMMQRTSCEKEQCWRQGALSFGENEDSVHLKRLMGLPHSVAIICGLIIGSGIYVSPKAVLLGAESVGLSLLLWATCGAMATLGALSFTELGTTFPQSGEKLVYLEKMFGPFVSFLYLWLYLLFCRPGANAVKCLTFGIYVLQPFYTDCPVPMATAILLAVILASVVTFINAVNVKVAAQSQEVFVTSSTLALIVIAITGLVWLGQGHTEHLKNSFENTSWNLGGICVAIYAGIYSFWGWNALNFLVEEVKNPYKTLPRAICLSMLIVTVLYLLVNLAYFVVLGPQRILQSDAVAVTLAQKTLGPVAWMMPIFILINTAGSLNSGILAGSRLCFAGARRGHLPHVLGLINVNFLTPVTSVIFQGCLTIIFCCAVDIYTLLSNMIFANTCFDGLTAAGIIYLRYKRPDLHRPIKMPIIIPALFLVTISFLACISIALKPSSTAAGLLLFLGTGIPYYVIFVVWKKRPKTIVTLSEKFTIFTQKLLVGVRQEGEPNF